MRSNDLAKLSPWGPEKKLKWFLNQPVHRSYHDDVLVRLEALKKSAGSSLKVEQYGKLTINPEKFPLFAVRTATPSLSKPNILITGGVHGYETSGVKGALLFLENHIAKYSEHFNFVVAPCVSPWSWETINRLDPVMENPNREFKPQGKAEESLFLMSYLSELGIEFDGHIDLHETTNSDKVFLPEEYSKNGLELHAKDIYIPDGFYLIGTEGGVRAGLEKSMMDAVAKVTHIAPADERGMILDTPLTTEGVIHSSIPGLCAEMTTAVKKLGAYTTEMYPDSPKFNGMSVGEVEATCAKAQVACVVGALEFWVQTTA